MFKFPLSILLQYIIGTIFILSTNSHLNDINLVKEFLEVPALDKKKDSCSNYQTLIAVKYLLKLRSRLIQKDVF